MKTFVVVSDSHARAGAIDRVSHLFAENDFLIHLGDGSGDMRPVMRLYPEKTYVMKGNCDFSFGEEECVIEAEGVRIFCCHGHKYGVKHGLSRLAARAKELDCGVALYGHTHTADIATVDDVLCVNPGALGDYAAPSYCYMVAHRGNVTATIVRA